jgi:hypothetical protein
MDDQWTCTICNASVRDARKLVARHIEWHQRRAEEVRVLTMLAVAFWFVLAGALFAIGPDPSAIIGILFAIVWTLWSIWRARAIAKSQGR